MRKDQPDIAKCLFVDARKLGTLIDRGHREQPFSPIFN